MIFHDNARVAPATTEEAITTLHIVATMTVKTISLDAAAAATKTTSAFIGGITHRRRRLAARSRIAVTAVAIPN
jgi:hypothetical protein